MKSKIINKIKDNIGDILLTIGVSLVNIAIMMVLGVNYLFVLGVELIAMAVLVELYKKRNPPKKEDEIIHMTIPHWKEPREDI